jgi:hypothetical protein
VLNVTYKPFMLSVVMLNVVMVSVVMVSVVAQDNDSTLPPTASVTKKKSFISLTLVQNNRF